MKKTAHKKKKVTNGPRKKPSKELFQRVLKELGGNLTKLADYFGVSRSIIYVWMEQDPSFKTIVRDERSKLFDAVLDTSRVVALGIPKYEYETDFNGEILTDENGRPKKVMVGWSVPPDPNMLRYFMSKLGRRDGFGEDPMDDDETSVKNGVSIRAWIQKENEG